LAEELEADRTSSGKNAWRQLRMENNTASRSPTFLISRTVNSPGRISGFGSGGEGSLKKFFPPVEESGTPVVDSNGAVWMEFSGEANRPE